MSFLLLRHYRGVEICAIAGNIFLGPSKTVKRTVSDFKKRGYALLSMVEAHRSSFLFLLFV